MSQVYNKVEVIIDQPDLPTWSTTWPGVDGCGSSSVYYAQPTGFTGPPTNSWDSYEPERISVSKNAKSFKGIQRGYPPYRFTPYHISRTIMRQHLVKRLDGATGCDRYYQYGYNAKEGGSTCHRVITSAPHEGPLHSKWYTVTHDYTAYQNYVIHGFDAGDISAAISRVQNQMISDALSSYDALTDIAELRQVPGMLSSMSRTILNIVRGMRGRFGRNAMRACANIPIRELIKHPSRLFRALGNEWMTYRYGIMPLLYSCQDILKTIDRGQDVETRSSETVMPRELSVSLPGSSNTFRRTRIDGSIVIRGCIFQHFTSTELSRLSGLGVNPFVTAWELIPYSFVIDWFVNVGDYIAAKTGSSFAQRKWACLSRRNKYTTITEVHLPQQDKTCGISLKTPTNWYGSLPPTPPPVILSNPEGYFPVESTEVDGYSRWIVDVTGAQLVFKPTLNWRRYLDTAVLSLNLLRSFMRSLR